MRPDTYAGKNADKHRPEWWATVEGCRGVVDRPDVLQLAANTFPPGTVITVFEPQCPHCRSVATLMANPAGDDRWECDCDFDWKAWAEQEYA